MNEFMMCNKNVKVYLVYKYGKGDQDEYELHYCILNIIVTIEWVVLILYMG